MVLRLKNLLLMRQANELLDIFRFKSTEQMLEMFNNDSTKTHIEEEIADALFFCT